MIEVRVDGLRELELKLLAMSERISRKVTRNALSKAIGPIKELAKDLAPDGRDNPATVKRSKYPDRKGGPLHPPPGTLKRAIAMVRNVKASRPGKEVYMVIVRRGYSSRGNRKFDAYYANMMENKFPDARTKGLGFMRKAFQQGKDRAIETFREELAKGIKENW